MTGFKKWCYLNVILPGALLVDGNNTTDQCVSCHTAALPTPGLRLLRFMEESWFLVLLMTLVAVVTVGVFLSVHHLRWKKALKEQLERGHIDQDQYDRLK